MGNSPHNNANSKKRWRRNGCSNLGVRLSFVLVVTVTCSVNTAHAGSRLIEPPSRPSLWRYGFGTAVNFNDDEVMCGGYDVSVNRFALLTESGHFSDYEYDLSATVFCV